jgi:transposase
VENHAAVMKVWAKRQRELSGARTQVVCRLHAVLCDLIPGGVKGQLRAPAATRLLERFEPDGAVAAARYELALEFLADLVRIDEQIKTVKARIAAVVKASKTTLTTVFGVGPVVAATIIGEVFDAGHIPNKAHFASYNGTAPIEVSSGPKKIFRLSRRGNRRVNHAIHMAAVTQVAHKTSPGRAYYEKKLAEGKTGKEALRAVKRRISDAVYTQLVADTRLGVGAGPGGQPGNDIDSSAAGSHPEHRLFGQATPGPTSTLRPAARRRTKQTVTTGSKKSRKAS